MHNSDRQCDLGDVNYENSVTRPCDEAIDYVQPLSWISS